MQQRIEQIILKNLIHNEEYSRKVLPFLNKAYFMEPTDKILYEQVDSFINKYNKNPSCFPPVFPSCSGNGTIYHFADSGASCGYFWISNEFPSKPPFITTKPSTHAATFGSRLSRVDRYICCMFSTVTSPEFTKKTNANSRLRYLLREGCIRSWIVESDWIPSMAVFSRSSRFSSLPI